MPYSYITFAQAQQQLANRLGDSGMVFYVVGEIQTYIIEAIRCWNAHTNYFRDRGTFNTAANTPFYDITTNLIGGTTLLRKYNVTDRNIVNALQYHLIESVN